MTKVLFIDIPVVEEKWDLLTKDIVQLRYMAQDCINLLAGVPKPFQQKRRQFSRGILCIASFLESAGHKAKYLRYEEILDSKHLKRKLKNIDIVGVTGNNTAYFNYVKKVCTLVKDIDKDMPVVVGGYHVTALDKKILSEFNYIDIIVRGEGELAFLDLADGKPLSKIRGITYRKNSKIIKNKPQRFLTPEEIPLPAYHLLPGKFEDYNYNIQTVRGCIYRCAFCPNGFFWKVPRFTPLEKVMEELTFLNRVLKPITLVHFSDNIFSLDRKRALDLCKKIRENDINLVFSCDLRANHTDPELIRTMAKSNFLKISLGFEDINNHVLEICNKQLTFEENVQAAKIIKQNSHIFVEAYWIIGLPGSNHATVAENLQKIRFLLRNNIIDVVSSSTVFTPLPGTPIFDNEEKFGIKILTYNWDNYLRSCFFPVYETEELSQLELYHYFNIFEWFLLREYLKKLCIESINELKKLHEKLMSKEYEKELKENIKKNLEKLKEK